MQLLFPSLILLLAAVAIAFFILPRVAPMVLVIGSGITFAIALYFHWSKFGVSEYDRATWQNNLKQYGSLLLMAIILLAAYGFYAMNQGAAGEALATPALPALMAPATGGGLGSLMKSVSSRISHLVKHGRIE